MPEDHVRPRGGTGSQRTRREVAGARHSRRARLRYRFDNSLARGPMALVAWLAGFVLTVALIGAILLNLLSATFGGSLNGSLPEDFWQSVLRTVDSGTFAADTAWPTRLVALTIPLSGVFLEG